MLEQQLILAQAYTAANNIDGAIAVYKSMIKLLSETPHKDTTICFWLALVKNNLAKIYFVTNDFEKAAQFSVQAVLMLDSIKLQDLSIGQRDEFYGSMAQCKANLSLACEKFNRDDKSQKYIKEALDCVAKITNKDSADLELEGNLERLVKEEKSTAARTSFLWVAKQSETPATPMQNTIALSRN